jgi:hypothetical protein
MASSEKVSLIEGEDYYWEEALMVFTARYHLRRGYCCKSNCRHCPYRKESALQTDSEVDARAHQPQNND